MKKLILLFSIAFLAMACGKEDDVPIYNPTNPSEKQKEVDSVYADLEELALENGYTDVKDLLEEESWELIFNRKYITNSEEDTIFFREGQKGGIAQIRFQGWFDKEGSFRLPYMNTKTIHFTLEPDRFLVQDGPSFYILSPTRYIDSTFSFVMKRTVVKDSLTTIEEIKLQTGS